MYNIDKVLYSMCMNKKPSLNDVLELITDDAIYKRSEIIYFMRLLKINASIPVIISYEKEGLLPTTRSNHESHFGKVGFRQILGSDLKKAITAVHQRRIDHVVGKKEENSENQARPN